MSLGERETNPTISNFASIFKRAAKEYKKLTKKDLRTHPFAAQFDRCDSPDAVLAVFRGQAQTFEEYRKGDDGLMKWLDPTVNVLFTLSATLGEGLALVPFSPAKMIFAGIGLLFNAAIDVVAIHDTLVKHFERVHFFLQRLDIYNGIPLTEGMKGLLGKIMAQVLSFLAVSTKEMAQSRIKKYMKTLLRLKRTSVQDALQRLDELTKEEFGMTAARNLQVTHDTNVIVKTIEDLTHGVDGTVNAIKDLTNDVYSDVKATKLLTQDMNDDVKATRDLTQGVDGRVKAIMEVTQDAHWDMKAGMVLIQDAAHDAANSAKASEEVTRNVKNATDELKLSQSREAFRTWLAPPNPSINHNIACDIQHNGSATWFVQGSTSEEWKRNGSLLWIRGNPGSGKSILCSAIIEDIKHMQQAGSALLAYYYFDFKDIAKRDIRGLLSSLLIQLCDHSDLCWDVLSRLYTTCGNGSEQPSEATLISCLREMLELPGQIPIYIIVDAVDECPNNIGTPSPREKVLDFLKNLIGSKHSNLYMCITSRPEQDIQTTLSPFSSGSRRVSLHEEGGQREDIMKYVRSFVYDDEAMRRWRAEDKELVINTLSERADGMFRWVFCQLDTLRRCIPASIRKALNELPTTLDETYEKTLQCIPKEQTQDAHRLFQCLIAAIRPLRVEELAEIFAIQFDSKEGPSLVEDWRPEDPEKAVLTVCSCLIAIVDVEDSKIVQFSHFSVKEFLTSDRLAASNDGNISRYHIPLGPAHTILVQACLTVLLQLDNRTDKTRLGTFPLAFYAAQHWVDHAKFGSVALEVGDAMERLFDPKKSHIAAWTWIHDRYSDNYRKSMDKLDEHPSSTGATPLYYAALCGFTELAKQLIITHAEDVNVQCGWRETPLYGAFRGGQLECMRLLLEHGADTEARIAEDSVLHLASRDGQVEVVRLLLQHNADVNAQGYMHQTPLHDASSLGHLKVAQLVLEYGADVNAQNEYRSTPLHLASESGDIEAVRLLLTHGADVHIRDSLWGRTPFQRARLKGHHEVTQLLLEHGARDC
ncbi:hypothetical protein BJV78DRAFT_1284306 [Lactifluus subvellereus]|nr:hypothetical protein BJV78DRAFT_1284306 [Lactifluus subvellereus]